MSFALGKQMSASRTAIRTQAPTRSVACAAINYRQSWAPGAEIPAHLNATLPGDFGFDPLMLGKDPESLRWYVQSELVHGRTAMTAVAGILIPGLLTKAGALSIPQWYDAGKVSTEATGIPPSALFIVMMFLCGFVEIKRWQDFKSPMSQGEPGSFFGFEGALKGTGDNGYPGGAFDPMGLSKESPAKLFEWKEKELANGRLAMLALLGFAAQHGATGTGPVDNLFAHIADPWHTTFVTNGLSVPASTKLV